MSSRHDWETPHDLFAAINDALGPFELDVAASHLNRKCKLFIDKNQNSFEQDWAPGWWCNPPYSYLGTPLLPQWAEKAAQQAAIGNWGVMLLPYDTSTRWFQTVRAHADLMVMLVGTRIAFIDPSGQERDQPKGTHFLARFTQDGAVGQQLMFWDWRTEPFRLRDTDAMHEVTNHRLVEQNKKLFERYQNAMAQLRAHRATQLTVVADSDEGDSDE